MPQLCPSLSTSRTVPAGSYVAPEPVVDTTRPFQFQWSSVAWRPSSNMSRLLPQCTRHQRLWWSTSRPLQPCTRQTHCGEVHRARSSRIRGTCAHHARSGRVRGRQRLWRRTSRPLQPYTRHQHPWSTSRPLTARVRGSSACGGVHAHAPAVYAAQAPHCASTGILLDTFKKVPPCTWRSRPYCLYLVRESSAACTRVDACLCDEFFRSLLFGGGVATTSGQQHHLHMPVHSLTPFFHVAQCSDVPCTQPFGSHLSFHIFRCYSAAAAQLPSTFSVARKEYRRRARTSHHCLNEQQQQEDTHTHTRRTHTHTHKKTHTHTQEVCAHSVHFLLKCLFTPTHKKTVTMG